MKIYINLNHYYWPKKGIIESKVESELESKYIANHLTILSLLERILAFGAAPLPMSSVHSENANFSSTM